MDAIFLPAVYIRFKWIFDRNLIKTIIILMKMHVQKYWNVPTRHLKIQSFSLVTPVASFV